MLEPSDTFDAEAGLSQLAFTLQRYRFRFADENDLQQAIDSVLRINSISARREKALSARDRPDFMLECGLAIEVKIDGSLAEALRQVGRYTEHERVRGILLIGSPAWLDRAPLSLAGKPLRAVRLPPNLL